MEENLSKRVNALRFLLIVFVVIIHNNINADAFEGRGLHVIIPDYVKNVQRFFGIITSTAVPLYFLFSAYFLYGKEQNYISVLRKKSRTIMVPYFLWSILFIGFCLLASMLPYIKHFFQFGEIMQSWNLFDWIKAFFGDYTDSAPPPNLHLPFVGQFWFLRDLFILNIFYLCIKKIVDLFSLGMLVLCIILWINNVQIYFVASEALIFFVFGYYCVKYNLGMKHIDKIKSLDLFLAYFITIGLEYFFVHQMPVLHKINIIIGCMFFLKISKNIVENIKLYKILTELNKYQFIVYALHIAIIQQVIKVYIKIIPLNGIYILFGYFVVIFTGLFFSLLLGMIVKNISPKIYGVLTGGRTGI